MVLPRHCFGVWQLLPRKNREVIYFILQKKRKVKEKLRKNLTFYRKAEKTENLATFIVDLVHFNDLFIDGKWIILFMCYDYCTLVGLLIVSAKETLWVLIDSTHIVHIGPCCQAPVIQHPLCLPDGKRMDNISYETFKMGSFNKGKK